MMGGAVHGGGGAALGRHNSAPQEAGDARPGSSRGLMSEGIAEQLVELTEEARASGHKAPLRHAWASPPPGAEWTDREWDAYWTLYERAQGLEGCAYSEAVHDKPGPDGRPPHRHRVYLALTERGTLVRTGWDYARQEAVSRITEHDTGAAMVKGKHNKHAARIARDLGREDVARAMTAAGLLDGPPAIAGLTPAQRKQQERTGVLRADVATACAAAWKASDGGAAMVAALAERGLALAAGDKPGVFVAVDRAGGSHSLARMLADHGRATGEPMPKAAGVRAMLRDIKLPSVAEAQVAQRIAMAEPAVPVMEGAAPAHDHEAVRAPVVDPAPQAPDPGQPVPASAEQAPTAGAKTAAIMPMPGGGAPAGPGGDDGGGGGSLAMESIDGPGEPPGPGASIQEVQRWRERWADYEERRGRAWLALQAAIAAENQRNSRKGAPDAHAQAPAHSHPAPGTPGARPILSAVSRAWFIRAPGQAGAGHGRHGHAHPGRGAGHARDGAEGGELSGGDVPPGGGRGRSPGRREGAAGGDVRPAGLGGRQALRHRAALARAAAALGSIDTGPLLDRLDPGRACARPLDAEEARIARRRALEPHQCPLDRDPEGCARAARAALWRPLHAARAALPAAMERARAAAMEWRWWQPATWREHTEAAAALARAHAAVSAATPSGDTLDEAGELARRQAEAARDANVAWQAGTGRLLDRRAELLAGIRAALDGGDAEIRCTLLGEGVGAAMRLQAMRESMVPSEAAGYAHEALPCREDRADGVVVAFLGPG